MAYVSHDLGSMITYIFGKKTSMQRRPDHFGIYFNVNCGDAPHTYKIREGLLYEGPERVHNELLDIRDSMQLWIRGDICL